MKKPWANYAYPLRLKHLNYDEKILIPAALIAAAILSGAAKKNDPTLMTVNGKPVKVSEFTYLYNKNNQQQAEPQTLDEYVDMFVNYRLKVADAEAAGLDTTAAFKKEYDGYCDDLAKPFLTDSTVVEKLSREAYERMKKNVKVSHIMLPIGRTPDERMANRARLDSIRTAILNGADFGDMAVKYSSDRSAQRNRGSMGYVKSGSFPYPFEYAAYNTPVGQISEVIDDAPYGWHIIRVDDVRPDAGEWHARHILKLTRGLDEAAATAKKLRSIRSTMCSPVAPISPRLPPRRVKIPDRRVAAAMSAGSARAVWCLSLRMQWPELPTVR